MRASDSLRDWEAGEGSLSTRADVIESHSEEDTVAAGRRLGASLQGGDVVLLYGDLGAGKTAFVRGLADGLGIDPDEVTSPTFTIVQEYRGPELTLQHVDLYRLSPAEVADLGLEDLVDSKTVMAVEWAERMPGAAPPSRIEVRIEHADDGRRLQMSRITPHRL
ncbi:MAG TPA: tRNA (adenosine(37)-N6)-threonylcarbamoyltransferase complex ATPase subunit type 1 TsaE [Vicinamibacterales bacterium]|nr:tRNA (adenosine(37)-N6)-threonylcarbamoyltransferase complex ATPase subunit type 1 TsaE [Vicinamibacterales bacterium]